MPNIGGCKLHYGNFSSENMNVYLDKGNFWDEFLGHLKISQHTTCYIDTLYSQAAAMVYLWIPYVK